ncbi:hypothetical protein [Mesorhizobium sp. 1M-11]|uniref:hypothetical protein n=1 Tax=Mesorhizobium sp. 1M-11 TaxID=1529006 RepID=UPI0006C74B61|nr:hypothetical protein [Mesorhizobium sp. 1M-11]
MSNPREVPSIEFSVNLNLVKRAFIFISKIWWIVLLLIATLLTSVFFYQYSVPNRYQAEGMVEIGKNGTEWIETQDQLLGSLRDTASYTTSAQKSCRTTATPLAEDTVAAATSFTPSRTDGRVVQIAAIMDTPNAAKQCVMDLIAMVLERHKAIQAQWETSEKANLEKRLAYVKSLQFTLSTNSPLPSNVQIVLPFDTAPIGKQTPTKANSPIQVDIVAKIQMKRLLVLGALLVLLLAISVATGRNFASLQKN